MGARAAQIALGDRSISYLTSTRNRATLPKSTLSWSNGSSCATLEYVICPSAIQNTITPICNTFRDTVLAPFGHKRSCSAAHALAPTNAMMPLLQAASLMTAGMPSRHLHPVVAPILPARARALVVSPLSQS